MSTAQDTLCSFATQLNWMQTNSAVTDRAIALRVSMPLSLFLENKQNTSMITLHYSYEELLGLSPPV